MVRWCVLLLMFLSACAGQMTVAPAPAQTAAATNGPGEYTLRPADKVRVTVYNEPTLSGEFTIAASGTVALPLLGEVQAQGLTAAQLDAAIEKGLADGYLRSPNVAVEVLTFRPFYVLGEVNRAGEFPYTGQITVLQAIATAQGFTYRANRSYVFIKRAGQDNEERVKLTPSLQLGPGDTIRVGERYF